MSDPRAEQAELLESLLELRKSGLTDAQILEQIAREELEGTGIEVPESAPPTIPSSGCQPWGRWSQNFDAAYVEITVEKATIAKSIECQVQVGFLDVRIGDEPILSGRLAQPMQSDVNWALDENADGLKILCIDLRKREPLRKDRTDATDFDACVALFESLRVYGEDFAAPGLVSGNYLPLQVPNAVDESQDGFYGGFDGTAPDPRGPEDVRRLVDELETEPGRE